MKTYAFVFARGGSKGLPGKNIKPLNGKPLILYAVEMALSLPDFDAVYVSTDDGHIAEVVKTTAATLIERPAALATDTAKEWDAWRHAVTWVTEHVGPFDRFVSLPATSPLRKAEDVKSALIQYEQAEADICITIAETNRNPYFNMVRLDDHGLATLVNQPTGDVFRRQDAPIVYDIVPVVYVTTPEFITSANGLFDGSVTSIQVDKTSAIDIDDIYDFYLAQAVLSHQQG